MDMRSQDVKLMKQLISINITIGSMTKSGHRNPVLRSASVCSLKPRSMERIANRRSAEVTTCLRNPLVRHRSAPVMVQGDERDDSNSGTQIFHASIRPFTFLPFSIYVHPLVLCIINYRYQTHNSDFEGSRE